MAIGSAFDVQCPSCSSSFLVDPERVAPEGVAAICSACQRVFRVFRPEAERSRSGPISRQPAGALRARTPDERARRLARVLVSDMVAYHPERHAQGLRDHSLRELFREEVQRSWAEFVAQVGPEMAESTSHFNSALNDILGRGEPLYPGTGRPLG